MSEILLTNNIQFKTYTRQNGLFSDLVLSMVEDPQRNLWVISEDALSKFNAANGTLIIMISDICKRRFILVRLYRLCAYGHLMLGTEGGVMEMNPALLSKSKYIPNGLLLV